MAAEDTSDWPRRAGETEVPGLGLSLAACGARITAGSEGGEALLRITLGFPVAGIADELARAVGDRLGPSASGTRIEIGWDIKAHAVQGNLSPLPNVRNLIAVASGKGGVGKSTTAVNLALALAAEGARVGILDADVYGPSQPTMLGLPDSNPMSRDGKTFDPLESYGLQAISMGFLVPQHEALIWRGPMVTQALQQLMFQTNWHNLDYLVVDLPPGTGDAQLTMTQKMPVSGALIVTTPQDIALLDARRGLKMFEKVNVAVLGVVENMSTYVCPACGHEEHLFGAGGGERLADEGGVKLLAQLPLDIRIRREADGGRPSVAADPDGDIARRYRDLARRVGLELALRPVDRKGMFGTVVVEKG
jgi:ATP-binding protein involved in chromosome partitioning